MRINPEKKEERDRVTRALLRATLRLAAAHGFTSLGLREVARAADIAPTSFYRHFADMEELGIALIDELVATFVNDWVLVDSAGAPGSGSRLDLIASRALLKAAEDPELMRFILAERLGAIGSFRAALAQKLAVVAVALREAMALEHGAQNRPAEHVGEAALVLVLEACGQLLERGEEHAPALRKRAALQIRTLAAGAFRDGAQS